ncbi:MAG: Gfo/Idh/MocA family oxidoreductase, partial [Pararhodobacter sp.]
VSGLGAASVAADLDAFVDGRRVDDNVHVMLRFEGGAKGMLWASQVAVGNENALRLRIYGDKGGLEWDQEDPNRMRFTTFGQPSQTLTRAGHGAAGAGLRNLRTPAGHPEGYLEAFATLYTEAAHLIRGDDPDAQMPGLSDGLAGMDFIAACIRSSQNDARWVSLTGNVT